MTARRRLGMSGVLLLMTGVSALADDPALAPGRDPSGTAVAVLADGFDYTRPELARVLARDGEGEAIAWDAVEGDGRPFARDGGGTDAALAVAAHGGVRLVPVRVASGDAASLARGLAFAVVTPARIVLVPRAADAQSGADVLRAAAQRFGPVLFVGAVAGFAADHKTQDESLPNLILLDAGDGGLAVADAVAFVLGCDQAALAGTTGAELKRAFLDRLSEGAPPQCEPKGNAKGE